MAQLNIDEPNKTMSDVQTTLNNFKTYLSYDVDPIIECHSINLWKQACVAVLRAAVDSSITYEQQDDGSYNLMLILKIKGHRNKSISVTHVNAPFCLFGKEFFLTLLQFAVVWLLSMHIRLADVGGKSVSAQLAKLQSSMGDDFRLINDAMSLTCDPEIPPPKRPLTRDNNPGSEEEKPVYLIDVDQSTLDYQAGPTSFTNIKQVFMDRFANAEHATTWPYSDKNHYPGETETPIFNTDDLIRLSSLMRSAGNTLKGFYKESNIPMPGNRPSRSLIKADGQVRGGGSDTAAMNNVFRSVYDFLENITKDSTIIKISSLSSPAIMDLKWVPGANQRFLIEKVLLLNVTRLMNPSLGIRTGLFSLLGMTDSDLVIRRDLKAVGDEDETLLLMNLRNYMRLLAAVTMGKDATETQRNAMMLHIYFLVETEFFRDILMLAVMLNNPSSKSDLEGLRQQVDQLISSKVTETMLTYVRIRCDATKNYNARYKVMVSDKYKALALHYDDKSAGELESRKSVDDYNCSFTFGPFTKVFKPWTGHNSTRNDDINLDEVVTALNAEKNVFIMGYGASGAGKTSSLVFQKSGNGVEQAEGVAVRACSQVRNVTTALVCAYEFFYDHNGETPGRAVRRIPKENKFFRYNKDGDVFRYDDAQEEYIHDYKFVSVEDAPSPTTESNHSLSRMLSFIIDKDRHVKATPNNPQSSRSHVVAFIKMYSDRDHPVSTLIIGDFAGVENSFDETDPITLERITSVRNRDSRALFYPIQSVYAKGTMDEKEEDKIFKGYDDRATCHNLMQTTIKKGAIYNERNKDNEEDKAKHQWVMEDGFEIDGTGNKVLKTVEIKEPDDDVDKGIFNFMATNSAKLDIDAIIKQIDVGKAMMSEFTLFFASASVQEYFLNDTNFDRAFGPNVVALADNAMQRPRHYLQAATTITNKDQVVTALIKLYGTTKEWNRLTYFMNEGRTINCEADSYKRDTNDESEDALEPLENILANDAVFKGKKARQNTKYTSLDLLLRDISVSYKTRIEKSIEFMKAATAERDKMLYSLFGFVPIYATEDLEGWHTYKGDGTSPFTSSGGIPRGQVPILYEMNPGTNMAVMDGVYAKRVTVAENGTFHDKEWGFKNKKFVYDGFIKAHITKTNYKGAYIKGCRTNDGFISNTVGWPGYFPIAHGKTIPDCDIWLHSFSAYIIFVNRHNAAILGPDPMLPPLPEFNGNDGVPFETHQKVINNKTNIASCDIKTIMLAIQGKDKYEDCVNNALAKTTFEYTAVKIIKSAHDDSIILKMINEPNFVSASTAPTVIDAIKECIGANKEKVIGIDATRVKDLAGKFKALMCRRKYAAAIATARTAEGFMINETLASCRSTIMKFIKSKMQSDSVTPPYLQRCLNTFCMSGSCFSGAPNVDSKKADTIFETIAKELGLEEKEMFERMVLCVFLVFNLTPAKETNPPPIPYIDNTELKLLMQDPNRQAHTAIWIKELKRVYGVIVDRLDPNNGHKQKSLDELRKQVESQKVVFDTATSISPLFTAASIVNTAMDDSNAVTPLGTLQFIENVSKYYMTTLTCEAPNKEYEVNDEGFVELIEEELQQQQAGGGSKNEIELISTSTSKKDVKMIKFSAVKTADSDKNNDGKDFYTVKCTATVYTAPESRSVNAIPQEKTLTFTIYYSNKYPVIARVYMMIFYIELVQKTTSPFQFGTETHRHGPQSDEAQRPEYIYTTVDDAKFKELESKLQKKSDESKMMRDTIFEYDAKRANYSAESITQSNLNPNSPNGIDIDLQGETENTAPKEGEDTAPKE